METTSELTGSSDSVEQQEISTTLESQRKELSPTEWTDEKHSLYLKSMEASFVDQLYNSSDLLSWQSQKDCLSDSISSRKMHASTRIPSGQFKVLRDGCWSKINFRRGNSQLKKADRSHALPANPWIQHSRTGCRHQTESSPSLPDIPTSTTDSWQYSGSNVHLYRHDSVGSNNTEVTDQNFVDEDVAKPCSRKRTRTSVAAHSSNDQVVPFGGFPATEITDNYVGPKK